MEEISEEQQLEIIREKTYLTVLVVSIIAVMAAFWAAFMFTPNEKAVFGTVALASGCVAVTLAMIRRDFFISVIGAASLTAAVFAYFIWLLPLLAR